MATTDDRPSTALQPILPPIVCTSWRRFQDGHSGMGHAEDPRCDNEEPRVYLDLADRYSKGAKEYVGVYVEHEGATAEAHVYLHFDQDVGVELTPQEARRLARHLRRMAELARVP